MIKYLYYMLIVIFTISNIEILEGRKINLKSKESSKSESVDFGGKNFESELASFKSLNSQGKTNKYYGWKTNNDIKPSEEIFFSLTIVPLGAYETKSVK